MSEVAAASAVPLIGNGDVLTHYEARLLALSTCCELLQKPCKAAARSRASPLSTGIVANENQRVPDSHGGPRCTHQALAL